MSRFLLILSLTLLGVNLQAQTDSTAAMITDRPTASAAASLVGKRVLQIETGYAYADVEVLSLVGSDARAQVLNLNTLIRYGITDGLELNVGQFFNRFRFKVDGNVIDGSQENEAFPTTVALRIKLAEEKGVLPDLALLSGITGSPFSDDETGTAFDMRLNANHTLTSKLSLGWNLGLSYFDDIDDITSIYTLVLGYSITPELAAFGEIFGTFTDFAREHSVDFGFTYLVNRNFQLDIYGGFGISDFAPDNIFGLGASFRLPDKSGAYR